MSLEVGNKENDTKTVDNEKNDNETVDNDDILLKRAIALSMQAFKEGDN